VLRVRADCGSRFFTAKFGVVLHYLLHQVLDHLLPDDAALLARHFCDCLRDSVDDFICFSPAGETVARSTWRTRCRAILISACLPPTPLHLSLDRPLLKRAGSLRPLHASASEVLELSDRGRCDNIASRERVFVTYVIQLGVAHVLPLRFRHRGGSALGLLFHVLTSP
jgi:hypothetical protein